MDGTTPNAPANQPVETPQADAPVDAGAITAEGVSAIEDVFDQLDAEDGGEGVQTDRAPDNAGVGGAPNAAGEAAKPPVATDTSAERAAALAAFDAEYAKVSGNATAQPADQPATPATTPPATPAAAKPGTQTPAQTTPDAFKGLRDMFVEEYGEQAGAKLDPLLATIHEQQKQLTQVNEFVTQAKQAREAAYEREVHGFFDGVLAKIPGRDKVYGDSSKQLTPEAIKTRNLVHFTAIRKLSDSMKEAQANPNTRALTPEQAMRWADELINGPVTENKSDARKAIESTVVKRHNQRTFTPTPAPAAAKPQTPDDLRQAGADAIRDALASS